MNHVIPEDAVEAGPFAPSACPLDKGRHEVYSIVQASPRGFGLYCRKCGKEWPGS